MLIYFAGLIWSHLQHWAMHHHEVDIFVLSEISPQGLGELLWNLVIGEFGTHIMQHFQLSIWSRSQVVLKGINNIFSKAVGDLGHQESWIPDASHKVYNPLLSSSLGESWIFIFIFIFFFNDWNFTFGLTVSLESQCMFVCPLFLSITTERCIWIHLPHIVLHNSETLPCVCEREIDRTCPDYVRWGYRDHTFLTWCKILYSLWSSR